MTADPRMNPGTASDNDWRSLHVLTVERRLRETMTGKRIPNHDEPPRLVFARRDRIAAAVEDPIEKLPWNRSIRKSPNRLAVSGQAVDSGEGTHGRSRSRVEPSMFLLKVCPVDMRIDLGRDDVGVAQHFLNCPEISTSFN